MTMFPSEIINAGTGEGAKQLRALLPLQGPGCIFQNPHDESQVSVTTVLGGLTLF